MEHLQQLAPYLLLFHVLCPFVVGLLLLCLPGHSLKIAQRASIVILSLLAISSLLLALQVIFLSASPERLSVVQTEWKLPGCELSPGLMDRIVWGVDSTTGIFVLLLPWLALTAELLTSSEKQSFARCSINLLLLGSLGLFVVGWDVGSLLCGAFFSVLLISLSIAQFGGDDRRPMAGLFLSIQSIGILLFAAGLAIFISSAGVIRSAPHGIPGSGDSSLPELAKILHTSIHQHPAAAELWEEYRGLPSLLLLGGIFLMAACFPLQTWMSEVGASASLGERLWLLAWVKGALLVGLRTLSQLDPSALHDVGWWGLSIAIPGGVFVASLLFAQAYLPRMQSSALCWTQQVTLVTAFVVTQELDHWLGPILVAQTASLVLLTVALSIISQRYNSVEITSFQGLSSRAGWLLPLLIVCTFTLTLSPSGLGLMQSWVTLVTLQGSETRWGSILRLLYLLADLLALAGMARITRQLGTGPLRLPEMSSALRERTPITASETTLTLSRSQICLLAGWGILALAAAFLFPLRELFTA